MIVEAVRRHSKLARIEGKPALLPEMLLDKVAQRIDRRVGRHQRRRASTGPARGQAHYRDGNESEIAAHGKTITLASEETLFMEIGAKSADPIHLRIARKRHHRIGGKRAQSRYGIARMVAKSARDIFGESQHPALGRLGAKPEAMRNGGRYDDGGRCLERNQLGLEC